MKLKPTSFLAPVRFALLQSAACILWMIYLGNGHAWTNQMGQWPAGLTPWTGSFVLDFTGLVLLFSAVLVLLGRRPVKNDPAGTGT